MPDISLEHVLGLRLELFPEGCPLIANHCCPALLWQEVRGQFILRLVMFELLQSWNTARFTFSRVPLAMMSLGPMTVRARLETASPCA
jgi:hypothetical protein